MTIATGINVADSPSPIVQPSAAGVLSTRLIGKAPTGSKVAVRMVYSVGLATITAPTVRMWGRLGDNGEWELLKTGAGGQSYNLVTDASDTENAAGTFKFTQVDTTLRLS